MDEKKENELPEEVKEQQENFDNAEVKWSTMKHRGSYKKRRGRTWITRRRECMKEK